MKKYKRRKIRYKRIIGLLICVCLIVGCIVNHKRIQLMFHGYSYSQQSMILSLSKDEQQYYFENDIDIESWNTKANNQHYYDYMLYQNTFGINKKDAIAYVDAFYDTYPDLEVLGYSLNTCRNYMQQGFTNSDFEILASSHVKYKKAKKYISVHGFILEDLASYASYDGSVKEAILTISHAQINSSNEQTRNYRIENPENITVLIKKGYGVSSEYEPNDLVEVSLPKANEETPNQMRQEAASALEKMASDASGEGMTLAINSAYRSYSQQEEIYNLYHEQYDSAYADSLVAIPGYSEHQLGLGVDMTSQSVIDGIYGTFGETQEYTWMMKNAYKYGFVLRYPEDKTDITGTTNEPWHFRYVGKKVAKAMHKNNWCLEEYILNKGFSYDLSLE